MGFAKHRDAEDRKKSAITAIKAILPLDLYPSHKRLLLSLALGKLTEADGSSKYKTRYRSDCAMGPDLRHDHVFTKKVMIEALIAHPERIDAILAEAVGCTVTKEEHDQLHAIEREFPNMEGWERYQKAGIVVIDSETDLPFEFPTG